MGCREAKGYGDNILERRYIRVIEVYYIEDDKNIAEIVKEYLGQKGYAVFVFPMIKEAKSALERSEERRVGKECRL